MNILHVWDQAGVSSILAKYQNKLGHHAEVIKREGFDKYEINKFYGTTIYHGRAIRFYRYILKRSKAFDIIHVHGVMEIVPLLRKPTVLHFHGSDLREVGFWGFIENWIAQKLVDKVLVSTPDLLSKLPKAEWLPTPIDTELFNSKVKKQCLTDSIITYEAMPSYLRNKEQHIQTKPWALSKLSLETLACGIPVNWNGLIIKGKLPERHKPENVAKRTIEIYRSILK